MQLNYAMKRKCHTSLFCSLFSVQQEICISHSFFINVRLHKMANKSTSCFWKLTSQLIQKLGKSVFPKIAGKFLWVGSTDWSRLQSPFHIVSAEIPSSSVSVDKKIKLLPQDETLMYFNLKRNAILIYFFHSSIHFLYPLNPSVG